MSLYEEAWKLLEGELRTADMSKPLSDPFDFEKAMVRCLREARQKAKEYQTKMRKQIKDACEKGY